MLQKVLDYEQVPVAGSWRAQALFVSDRGKNFDLDEAMAFEAANAASQATMKIPPHTATQLRYWSDYGGNNPNLIKSDIKKAVNGTLVDGSTARRSCSSSATGTSTCGPTTSSSTRPTWLPSPTAVACPGSWPTTA